MIIENRAKMLKADWFKNDITHVLIKMVSPLVRVGYHFSHLATIRYTTVFHIIKSVPQVEYSEKNSESLTEIEPATF